MSYVQLLDYSNLLKARHDELFHESITLHNYELTARLAAIMTQKVTQKQKRNFILPHQNLNCGLLA